MVEYYVNIRVNDKELKKVKEQFKEVEVKTKTEMEKKGGFSGTVGGKGFLKMVGTLGIIATVLSSIHDLLEPILNLVKFLVYVLLWPIIKPLMNFLTSGANKISGGMEEIKGFTKSKTGKILSPGIPILSLLNLEGLKEEWNNMGGILKNLGEQSRQVTRWAWNKIKEGFEGFREWVLGIWENYVVPAWEGFGEKIGQVWNSLILPRLQELRDNLEGIWEKYIAPPLEKLKSFLLTIWDKYIRSPFQALKEKAMTIWSDYIKPVIDKIVSAISSVASNIRGAMDKLMFWRRKREGSEQFGGTIPRTGLYLLHAGETIRPSTLSSPNINITINVSGGLGENIDEIARELASKIRNYTGW